ncbi:MAG: radical SAM protein [Elusimicrobiota bacterium]
MQHPSKARPKPVKIVTGKAPAARAAADGPIKIQTGPDHVAVMAVFVTNQCNLACTNCCADTVKMDAAPEHLKWEDFKNAIDIFMDPAQLPHQGQKVICVEGGETFLVYPLLQQAVEYVQKFPTPPHVYIHTNGTMVKPEQIQALRKYGVEILFSLDGNKEGNDHFRRFPGSADTSVWDAVMKRIEPLPKDGLGINMVVRPNSIEGLVGALKTLTEMGFGFINLAIDYYHMWSETDLKKLEKFMDELFDFYAGYTEKHGKVPFRCGAIHDGLQRVAARKSGKGWWTECVHLILGSDGNFYSCEAIGLYPWSEVAGKHSINHCSAGRGIDWAKRQAYMEEANTVLGEHGKPDSEWQHMCPRLYYTVAHIEGKDPKDLVDNMHRTSRILHGGLMKLAARLQDNPSFNKEHILADVVPGS